MSIVAGLLADLQKTYGAESAMYLRDMPNRTAISSGSLALDFATGIGGLPRDHLIEVAGAEGSGKTTLGIFTMKNFLEAQPNRAAMIIDTEHKLTDSWVEKLIGPELFNQDRILVMHPDTMEDATDIYTKAVKTGDVCFCMLDSIGGSPSQRVTEKSATKADYGGNSLAVTRFSQFAGIFSHKYDCLTFAVNQIRDDFEGWNRLVTPGGHALKHHAIMRLQVKKGGDRYHASFNGEELEVGYSVVVKVVKNGVAPPGRTAYFLFYNIPTEKYGFGIDVPDEVIRLSTATGVVTTAGGWFKHECLPGGKVQGRPALIKAIRESDEVREVISAQVLDALYNGAGAGVAPMSSHPEDALDDNEMEKVAQQIRERGLCEVDGA